MKALARIFNPVSWPIWLKLSSLLTLVLILVVFIAVLLYANLQAVDRRNLEAYLVEQGAAQRAAVASVLRDARSTLDTFVITPTYSRMLARLLLADNPVFPALDPASPEDVRAIMDARLIDTGLFATVRVLDLNGILLAGAGRFSINAIGQSEADSPAFIAAQNARVTGDTQTLTIWGQGVPTIEITSVIAMPDGTAIGYIIGRIAVSDAIIRPILQPDTAAVRGQYVPTFSYLVTLNRQNAIIFSGSASAAPLRARDSAGTDAVLRALDGRRPQGSAEVYSYQTTTVQRIQQGDALVEREVRTTLDVIGYYAPIPDALLGIIVETPLNSTFERSLESLLNNNNVFVLMIALPLLGVLLVALYTQLLAPPLRGLRQALRAMSTGNFENPIAAAVRGDEFGEVAVELVDARRQVKGLIDNLQERINARERDIRATQDISRFAATQRDIQVLMERVVDLIVDRFPNIYHAQIFMVDEDDRFAVLRASTGAAGRKLLERGHRLAVGSQSVIGRVTTEGRYVIARDTATSEVHRRNPLLEETRAELAIPLIFGDKVAGALDVQSKKSDSFTDDEIGVLQTMADQISVALENATLFQESKRRLEEVERSRRATTTRDWTQYMQVARAREINSEYGLVSAASGDLRAQAIKTREPAIGQVTERGTIAFAVPILLREEPLGAVEFELPMADFGEEKVRLAEELVRRLTLGLENARLFQLSQLATERERLVSGITARLTSQTKINDILETALREVGQALRSPDVSIRLATAPSPANGSDPSDQDTTVL